MSKLLPSLSHIPGLALDLTTVDQHGRPWDFDCPEQRARVWDIVVVQKPQLLIGSPMCTAFSAWQNLAMARTSDPDRLREQRDSAMQHLMCCCELYAYHVKEGRYFLHEHRTSRAHGVRNVLFRFLV